MRILVLSCMILLGSVLTSYAQLSTEEIAIVQSIFGMEKRAIITKTIKMTPTDSVGFWPLYEKYESDRKDLGKERIALIQTFVSKYPALSNEELNDLMEGALELDADQHDLLESYYSKIRKASSPMVAAQWLQLESYINLSIKLSIQEKLPFLGDVKIKSAK
ncbi:MAG TPA: hypothetical protein VK147_03600 [Candidatus Didemnitutus sp.]|nr:hypothetical protein [Candidatus Didemnitutus sp.]